MQIIVSNLFFGQRKKTQFSINKEKGIKVHKKALEPRKLTQHEEDVITIGGLGHPEAV